MNTSSKSQRSLERASSMVRPSLHMSTARLTFYASPPVPLSCGPRYRCRLCAHARCRLHTVVRHGPRQFTLTRYATDLSAPTDIKQDVPSPAMDPQVPPCASRRHVPANNNTHDAAALRVLHWHGPASCAAGCSRRRTVPGARKYDYIRCYQRIHGPPLALDR